MSTALARSNAHLTQHRRQVVLRSLVSGLVGMTPVPLLDDWLAATVRRGLIRKLAEARRVDVDEEAIRAVADGKASPPSFSTLLTATLIPRLLSRGLKKLVVLWAIAQRADETQRTFAVATMFDHYCTRLHVGAGLDAKRGRELRAAMDQVLSGARTRTATRLFRRGLAASARAALRAPGELLHIASGDLLSRLRSKSKPEEAEAEAVELVDGAIERAAASSGFLSKVTAAVETGLGTVGEAYVDELIHALEKRLRPAAENDMSVERTLLARARRVVVKIGSRLLKDSPVARTASVADELAELRKRGTQCTVVSSGAIALGMRVLGLPARPSEIPRLQAAAAVGQGQLMQHWERAFSVHGVAVGQVLLTHEDVEDRGRFLQARHTFAALADYGAVAIVNENDTVATDEIKFGDNDRLAALVCNLVSADLLIVLTDVDGLHDANPAQGGKRIPLVRDIDTEATPLAGGAVVGGVGSGGMASKVQAAKIAGRFGASTVVAAGGEPNIIARVLRGDDVGTLFVPQALPLASRKHWIAYANNPAGVLVVDDGAREALARQQKSLLATGIREVRGRFAAGDAVSVVDLQGGEFARGLCNYGSEEIDRIKGRRAGDIEAILGYRYSDEVIHRDDLVVL